MTRKRSKDTTRYFGTIAVCSLIVILAILSNVKPGAAAGAFVNCTFGSSTVTLGQSTSVQVTISNAVDVYGFQFDITPPGTVSLGVFANGGFITGFVGSWGSHGYYGTLIGQVPGKNGSGVLATSTITGASLGASTLTLHSVILSDSNAQSIPVTAGSCTLNVVPPADTSTPSPTAGPSLTPTPTATATEVPTATLTPTPGRTVSDEPAGGKFLDLNADGVEDESAEPAIGGWEIRLLNEGTGQEYRAITIANQSDPDFGKWNFPDMPAGIYLISEVQQEGWVQTHPDTNEGVYRIEYNGNGSYTLLSDPPTGFQELDFGNIYLLIPHTGLDAPTEAMNDAIETVTPTPTAEMDEEVPDIVALGFRSFCAGPWIWVVLIGLLETGVCLFVLWRKGAIQRTDARD